MNMLYFPFTKTKQTKILPSRNTGIQEIIWWEYLQLNAWLSTASWIKIKRQVSKLLVDVKAFNQTKSRAPSPKIMSLLRHHLRYFGKCGCRGSSSHVVKHNTDFDGPSYELIMNNRGAHQIWYVAQQIKQRKNKKCRVSSLCTSFISSGFNKILVRLCSYLVSKALLKKHTVKCWHLRRPPKTTINLHIRNRSQNKSADGWIWDSADVQLLRRLLGFKHSRPSLCCNSIKGNCKTRRRKKKGYQFPTNTKCFNWFGLSEESVFSSKKCGTNQPQFVHLEHVWNTMHDSCSKRWTTEVLWKKTPALIRRYF